MINRECGVFYSTYAADMRLLPLPLARWTMVVLAALGASGLAYRAAGNNAEARRHLQREIHRWAGSPSARAAEQALSELR